MNKTTRYDPHVDLTPIANIVDIDLLFAANTDFGPNTIQELVALAKEKPGAIKFANTGIGTIMHLNWEMLMAEAGIELYSVPYNGGGPAMLGGMADEVELVSASTLHRAMIRDGRLKPLAFTGQKRYLGLPNVPTMIESGFPDYVFTAPFGLFAPAGVPEEVTDKLAGAVLIISSSPEFVAAIDELGALVKLQGPEEFHEFLKAYTEKIRNIVEKAGISVE